MHHTLLIIDDETPIRESLRRLLRRAPYDLLFAASGDDALVMLADRSVDLILSDQNMPGLTGLQLFQKLRTQPQHEHTIRLLFTGQTDRRALEQAMADETLFHYVHKPWDPDDLLALLHVACRHLALMRENGRLLGLVRAQRKIIADLEQLTTTGSAG